MTPDHNYWKWVAGRLLSIDASLSQIVNLLTKEGQNIMTVKDDVNALVQEVSNQTTVATSVQTLLSQLTAIIQAQAANTTDPATATALNQAVAAIKANDGAIASAVTANTPAA